MSFVERRLDMRCDLLDFGVLPKMKGVIVQECGRKMGWNGVVVGLISQQCNSQQGVCK